MVTECYNRTGNIEKEISVMARIQFANDSLIKVRKRLNL